MLRSLAFGALVAGLAASPALAASKSFDLPPFEEVSVSAGIAAVIDVGGAQSVTADAATDAILQRLEISVRGKRLEIGLKWNILDWLFNFGADKGATVHVSAPIVTAVDSSAGADTDVHGMKGDTLKLSASAGAGLSADGLAGSYVSLDSSAGANLTVTGTCDKLIASSSAGASIQARDLACADVNADASAGAHANVRASASINADASAGGGVTVYGHPAKVVVNSSAGGGVDFAD